MSELVWSKVLLTTADAPGGPSGALAGRYADDDDPALTPIFHALTRGGWRSRQESPADAATAAARTESTPGTADPIETFRRDPLGAPLPAAAPAPEPAPAGRRRAGAHAAPELRRSGRHHRHLTPVDGTDGTAT